MSVPRVVGLSPAGAQARLASRLVPLVPAASPATSGTTVTSGTAAYGSWAELNAATAEDWYGFSIFNPTTGSSSLHAAGANHPCLLDVGIGAAASEVAIIGGVDVSNRLFIGTIGSGLVFNVPYLFIPKGSRVTARISSATSARAAPLAINGYKRADNRLTSPIRTATAFVSPSSQRGVAVSVGASWTEIVSSAPQATRALVLGIGANDATGSGTTGVVDLAVGASGAETQVWSTLIHQTTGEDTRLGESFVPIALPAGTRICARSSADAISMTIHGLS